MNDETIRQHHIDEVKEDLIARDVNTPNKRMMRRIHAEIRDIPDIDNREYITRLIELAKEKRESEAPMQSVNALLVLTFDIDGEPFTIDDFDNYQSATISSKRQAPELLNQLDRLAEMYVKDTPKISRLPALIRQGREQLEVPEKMLSIELNMAGMVRALGKFRVTKTGEREALYDFWEEVYPKFETMKGAINDFCDDFGSEASDVKQAVTELSPYIGYIKVHDPQLGEEAFTYSTVPDFFQSQVEIIKTFIEKKIKAGRPSEQFARIAEVKEGKVISESYDPDEFEELKDFNTSYHSAMEEVTEQRLLDPILLNLIDKRQQTAAVSKEDWETLRTEVNKKAAKYLAVPDSNILDEFETFLDEIEEELIGEPREIYFLPMNSEIQEKILYSKEPSESESGETHEFDKIENSTVKLFEELTILLSGDTAQGIFGEERGEYAKLREIRRVEGRKFDRPPRETLSVLAGTGLPNIGDIKRERNQMLLAIEDYYINPIATRYYGEKPKFTLDKNYQYIVRSIDKNPLGTALGNLIGETGSEIIFTASILNNLADVLEYHRPREELRMNANVHRNIKEAYDFLIRLFGQKKLNREWAATIIYVLSGGDVPKEWRMFEGENVEKLVGEAMSTEPVLDKEGEPVLEDGEPKLKIIEKHYPIQYLEDVFNTYEFRDQLGLTATKGRGRKGEGLAVGPKTKPITSLSRSDVDEDKIEMLIEAKRIMGLLNEIFLKSSNPLAITLLNAHDVIRKIMGKKIIYGKYCLTNADDVDYVLRKTNDDLSVMELEQIVYSVNSFENIGKAFGINEEIVYTIKGMCR
jgi:hypothetical protein